MQQDQHQQRHQARHQHAQRQVDEPEAERDVDIRCLHITIVDAEDEDQHDLGDEQQAEEERQAAQGLLAALLQRQVVDLIDRPAEPVNAGSAMMPTRIESSRRSAPELVQDLAPRTIFDTA